MVQMLNKCGKVLIKLNIKSLDKLQLPILTSWLVVGCPGAQTVVGVEVHGVDVLPPLDLLQRHGGLVRGQDRRGEGEAPVDGESGKH